MKNIFFCAGAATLAMLTVWVTPASALSCAKPVMSEDIIQSASAIFEGVVTAERKMVGGDESDVIKKMDKTATYTFQVTRAWKGVAKDSFVKVQRNDYWGDGFIIGQPYLVFGTSDKEGGPLTAEVCGPTVPLQYAEPYQKALAQYYAGRPQIEGFLPARPETPSAE
jgi:hypothetical protein